MKADKRKTKAGEAASKPRRANAAKPPLPKAKQKTTPSRVPGSGQSDPLKLFNRELSWLDFNARVLAQATFPAVPLLERVKFLAIFSSNLDEFFMVRVAGLLEQWRIGSRESASLPPGENPVEQLESISAAVRELVQRQSRIWQKEIQPRLAEENIEVLNPADLLPAEVSFVRQYFQNQVFPVLTPMAVDPAHPFPHLRNRGLSLCVLLRSRSRKKSVRNTQLIAFVEVPAILPRFVQLAKSKNRFLLLSDVIALHLPQLFGGSEVLDSFEVRVTRDSDLEIDEEDAEDLLKVIEAELRERQWGNAVRLEISSRAPEDVQLFLRTELELEKRDVYPIEGPLNYADFHALARLPEFDHLRYPSFVPHLRPKWRVAGNLFELIRNHDQLVHHPYESFSTVSDFIEAAATDPDVLAIKLTLYRTARESPIMRSLIKAAANGKQVVVLVELKARFDEANNILWARHLEHEGVHVVYGIVGLKTHCKACLIVRREEKHLRRYCHLATGNYNHTTAAQYTDLGLFTANPVACEDVANLFNMLTAFGHQVDWKRIVPSPTHMEERLVKLIKREQNIAKRGGKGRILCKMNSLVHPPLIKALYEASNAGVQIDLIVRGICCLRPGVPGLSENITVSSVVGRFLEHSRIFCFWQKGEPVIYLSSADWMQRNFFSRIEVMFPVEDDALRKRLLEEILQTSLTDNVNAWDLRSDGTWKRRTPAPGSPSFDSQAHFCHLEDALTAPKQ